MTRERILELLEVALNTAQSAQDVSFNLCIRRREMGPAGEYLEHDYKGPTKIHYEYTIDEASTVVEEEVTKDWRKSRSFKTDKPL